MSKKKKKEPCIICGKPSVAYWPAVDPDIEAQPYCRSCLDEAKLHLLMEMSEMDYEY